uniref:UDP binding domain-containing protein n=1 Tax=Mongoliimonas terrestris TaxID=1709001 RepID=UPI000AA91C52
DPEGMEASKAMLNGVIYGKDAYDCAADADALVIVTEWNAFRALDFGQLKALMATPLLVDLRNVYRREEIERHGFEYASVGRPS